LGYGQVLHSYVEWRSDQTGAFAFGSVTRNWYYNKNGIECGDFNPLWPTDVQHLSSQNTISIYPNPAYDKLIIAADADIREVAIINMVGQIITKQQYNSNHVQVDVSQLPSGVYFIRINNEVTQKFVKE